MTHETKPPKKPERVYFDMKSGLYDADPTCKHEIEALWSGIKCRKCPGWFCY